MGVCDSCHAGCCRSFAVPISGADILRLQNERNLSFWDFICRWADPEGDIARNHAPQFRFSDEPQTPFVICLNHAESESFPGTTKCQFLMECLPDEEHPLGQGRCMVHDVRPSTCRAFPTKLSDGGDLAIIYDVPERGRAEDNPIYSLCPRQWTVDDVDPIGTVQDLVVAKYEMTFFSQLADIWNANPRPWTLFPEFLKVVYGSRISREEKTETVAERPILRIHNPEQMPLKKAA